MCSGRTVYQGIVERWGRFECFLVYKSVAVFLCGYFISKWKCQGVVLQLTLCSMSGWLCMALTLSLLTPNRTYDLETGPLSQQSRVVEPQRHSWPHLTWRPLKMTSLLFRLSWSEASRYVHVGRWYPEGYECWVSLHCDTTLWARMEHKRHHPKYDHMVEKVLQPPWLIEHFSNPQNQVNKTVTNQRLRLSLETVLSFAKSNQTTATVVENDIDCHRLFCSDLILSTK